MNKDSSSRKPTEPKFSVVPPFSSTRTVFGNGYDNSDDPGATHALPLESTRK